MHVIVCPGCGYDGPYYIAKITEDIVVVRCPHCGEERGLPVGMDLEDE